ncbi:MAG TPA: hypothetical protein VIC62_18605 [Nakamurella sp.]|jgi:hypothetical protein
MDSIQLWFPLVGGIAGWLLGAVACLVADRTPRLAAADRDLLAVAAAVGVSRG